VWRDVASPERRPLASLGALSVTPVAHFGTDTGEAMLGLIGAVAVNAQELFVFDRATCEVVVFDRVQRSVRRRFGRCGKGPTDLGFVTALALMGDTLLLTDRAGEALSLWHTSGTPLATHRLRLQDSTWSPAFSMGVLGTGRIGLSVELRGNRGGPAARVLRAQGAAHVRVVDLAGRQTEPGFLVDGDGPERQTQGFARGLPICASRSSQGVSYVAAFNGWVPQFAVMSMDPPERRVLLNIRLDGIPLQPVPHPQRSRAMLTSGTTAVACDPAAVIASALVDSTAASSRRRAWWIHFDLRTSHLVATTATAVDAEWFGFASAVAGDRVFVIQNRHAAYPRVLEVVLTRAARDSRSAGPPP
jgi:hypothetical protein